MILWTTTRALARSPGDLAEELAERFGPVRDERIVLDVVGGHELADGFLRLLLVDHQIIETQDVGLVARGAAVVWVDKLNHG